MNVNHTLNARRIVSNVVCLVAAIAAQQAVGQGTIHVDQNATGQDENGADWCNAYRTLEPALRASRPGDTIRVADGLYTPDVSGLDDPREATFKLQWGVTIEGGYAGCGADDPDARDFTAYETILSGDLNGDDGPDFSNNDENCYHVVTGNGVDSSAVLEGFTITGGNANGPSINNHHAGGGMLNVISDPTIRNCLFLENRAVEEYGVGGAMANILSNPYITRCRFRKNYAGVAGGGVFNFISDIVFRKCMFDQNECQQGSAMFNAEASNIKLVLCEFSENGAASDYAAALVNDSGTLEMIRCRIEREYQRGLAFVGTNTAVLTGCSFNDIRSIALDGADGASVDLSIKDSSFVRNGGGLSISGVVTVEDCSFVSNSSALVGGINGYRDSLRITRCIFISNTKIQGADGGGVYFSGDRLEITNSYFRDNVDRYGGGALSINSYESSIVSGCIFEDNEADNGGALSITRGTNTLIQNSMFLHNNARDGGAIFLRPDTITTLSNCVVWGNRAQSKGGVLYMDRAEVSLVNSIVGENEPQDFYDYEGTLEVRYSNILGGWPGEGNIDADPLFVNAEAGDFRLRVASPCIDVGDDSAVLEDTDLDGNPRIVGSAVDMGAYENLCSVTRKIRAKCVNGGLRGKVRANLPGGTRLTLLRNGTNGKTVVLDLRGVGRAKWKRADGPQEVCLLGCAESCSQVDCP